MYNFSLIFNHYYPNNAYFEITREKGRISHEVFLYLNHGRDVEKYWRLDGKSCRTQIVLIGLIALLKAKKQDIGTQTTYLVKRKKKKKEL